MVSDSNSSQISHKIFTAKYNFVAEENKNNKVCPNTRQPQIILIICLQTTIRKCYLCCELLT